MSLSGCQINPIDVNFHLQKVWKFLVKIQLTKSDPKRTGGGKCPASCQLWLMVRVLANYLADENLTLGGLKMTSKEKKSENIQ